MTKLKTTTDAPDSGYLRVCPSKKKTLDEFNFYVLAPLTMICSGKLYNHLLLMDVSLRFVLLEAYLSDHPDVPPILWMTRIFMKPEMASFVTIILAVSTAGKRLDKIRIKKKVFQWMLMSEQSSWSRKYQWETERVLKHYQKDGVFKGPVHLNHTQKRHFTIIY